MKRLIVASTLVALLGVTAQAQQAGESTNWPTSCQSLNRQQPLTCVASTVAFLRETGQKMAEMRVITTAGGSDRLQVIGPFGVLTDRPFVVKANGEAVESLAVRTCEQDGCHALADISPALRDALIGAETLSVTFSRPDQPDVEIPLPVTGLAAAYRSIAP
jgi:invasion protein IalB